MEKQKTIRIYAAIGAIIGWLVLVLQLVLFIENRTVSVAETVLRFFSYFTIQTNIFVAACFTAAATVHFAGTGGLSSRATTYTATAVYISLTGIIYNSILRFLWEPQGLQLIVDEALHTFQPLLFVIFWLFFIPKAYLRWAHSISWLTYPALYIVYVIILGALTGFYPYPFANVNELGYAKALLNAGGIVIVVLVIALVFIAIAKASTRRTE